MQTLVADVIPLILEQAYHRAPPARWAGDPLDNIDKDTLCACALVDSSWRVIAQSLLLRTVKTNRMFDNTFLRLNVDESRSALLQHVRIARIGSIMDASADILALLERCTLLHTLIFCWTNTNLMSSAMISKLRQLAESRPLALRSLRILPRTPYDLEQPPSAKLYQLLAPFTTLKSLWLAPDLTFGSVPYQCRDLQFGSQLEDLLLGDPMTSQTTLRWFLQSSQGSLRLIDFRFELGLDRHAWVKDTLRPFSGSIRTLRFGSSFTTVHGEIVRMCTRLEELIIDIGQNLGQPFIPPVLYPSFKHLLVSISIYIPRTSVPGAILVLTELVESHASLRSLRLWGSWIRLLQQNQEILEGLQHACKSCKVEFEMADTLTWPEDVRMMLKQG